MSKFDLYFCKTDIYDFDRVCFIDVSFSFARKLVLKFKNLEMEHLVFLFTFGPKETFRFNSFLPFQMISSWSEMWNFSNFLSANWFQWLSLMNMSSYAKLNNFLKPWIKLMARKIFIPFIFFLLQKSNV